MIEDEAEAFVRMHNQRADETGAEDFGRDEVVVVNIKGQRPQQAFVVAFLVGGVMLDIIDQEANLEGSVFACRGFFPYSEIQSMTAPRRDMNLPT